jgi:hypothetical protein
LEFRRSSRRGNRLFGRPALLNCESIAVELAFQGHLFADVILHLFLVVELVDLIGSDQNHGFAALDTLLGASGVSGATALPGRGAL